MARGYTWHTCLRASPLAYEEGPTCAFLRKDLGKQCAAPEDWWSVSSH